jgi:IS30 family transposase
LRYKRLTREERYQIQALIKSGLSIRKTADTLGRAASTISREIHRNSSVRGYRPVMAHEQSLNRRTDVHPPLRIQGEIEARVRRLLLKKWSPEQISGRLRLKEHIRLAPETIYSYIYRDFKSGGSLHVNLRRNRKRRRSHAAGRAYKRCGRRLTYPPISTRPSIVEARRRLGDYERDTVLGKFQGPVLLTIVDRASRLTFIGKVERIDAKLTDLKTVQLLKRNPVHTITNDNGPEFANYKVTSKKLKVPIYFNDPYSSWQRGTNENTNGLIRQFYPKGTDFTKISVNDIKKVQTLLNQRPRKCLGFQTPQEVHSQKSQVLH